MKRASKRGVRGQSTLEYVLVVAAILAAIIAAVTAIIGPAATKTITESGNVIDGAATKLGTIVE